ncbi:transposase, partial [Halorubrum sp. SS7]|uniref:transposase n=1 Tax=Halorubrum sp. SS7 TaxID=2518119 RepID=UPI00237A4B8B
MVPLDVFGSESVAADLLQQVRWRDGVSCPRCRPDQPAALSGRPGPSVSVSYRQTATAPQTRSD